MKLSTIFAAILGAAIAGGGTAYYYQQHQGTAQQAAFTALPLDTAKAGEINSTSLVNLSNGVRSVPFTLTAEAGQFYKIAVAGALRAQISVLQNGLLIASSTTNSSSCNDCSSSSNTATAPAVLAFKAETAGKYDVVVSGLDSNAYGPFSVTATPLKSYVGGIVKAGMDITEIAMGRQQSFTLEVEENAIYTIDMKADQGRLDPYLTLLDKNGQELVADDDGGDNYDAKIQAYLEAGTYTIQTSSAVGADTFQGTYRLIIAKEALTSEITLESGAALNTDGAKQTGLHNGQAQEFSFELPETMLVNLDVRALGFDPDVTVDGASINYQSRGVYTLRAVLEAGTHTIGIESQQGGVFDLTLAASSVPANAGGGAIRVGDSRQAVMLSGVTRINYSLNITQAGTYVIDMASPVFDTSLSLNQNGYTIAENDDIDYSNGNTNSRIEMSLEPGQYQIQAMALSEASRNRDYSLSVKRK